MSTRSAPLTRWLERRSPALLNAFAIAAAFSTYFCMYAFRKPFAAGTYSGESVAFLGGEVTQKTLFVVAQILGYALSKYAGIRVCSETSRAARFPLLVGLVLTSEAALICFGMAPDEAPMLKALAILGSGLPLGMVWGTVVLYLEGRRTSELLLTGLSCSFIVAGGVVRDFGRALMAGDPFPAPVPDAWGWVIPNPFSPVPEFWMPAATGLLFLPPFLASAWLLNQLPEPTETDVAERSLREPMDARSRRAFVRRYALGVFAALGVYLLLTAFRDYRDNYAVEVFDQLGYDYASDKTAVSRAELLVAFGVMAVLSQLYRIRDNRRGLIATHAVMAAGVLLVGGATALQGAGLIDGFWWMTLIGLGAYLAYVPFNSVLFDRVIASTGFAGTAVFGIYLADSIGYTGSVALQIGKDLLVAEATQLSVLRVLSYVLASVGAIGLGVGCFAFLKR